MKDMSKLVYKPNAIKHFRRLAEAWRAHARELNREIKKREKLWKAGERKPLYALEIHDLRLEAEYYELLGKDLKDLASAVLHDQASVL